MQKNDISKYEYVSFDVFDTLIFRSVATPEDIFIIHRTRINCNSFLSLAANI